LVCA